MQKVFLWLLIFIPLTVIASALGASPIVLFFLSAIAIVPLAKFIGESTEALAVRMGTAWGSLLNVTFGNATELIVGIFAIHAGLIEVVKATITGSIIGNLLLVLGTAMMAGGIRFKKQTFNRTATLASGSTLFLAAVALTIPAILPTAAPGTSAVGAGTLSLLVALCMLVMYACTLIFSLYTHKHLYALENPDVADTKTEDEPQSMLASVGVLALTTLGVAWMSDVLVGAIQPLAAGLGWTPLFIGVIIVAIVGNAAEHTSAITMALKNKMDLAIQIAVGSATQVAIFVAPMLVFVSLFFTVRMDLVFDPFELASILLSIIIVNLVIEDGESNWLEGAQLLIAYVIMAIAFFVHP
jgi:Ca2+:H+ antiporter